MQSKQPGPSAESKVAQYRAHAAELAALAKASRSHTVRTEYARLAMEYEQLAEEAERRSAAEPATPTSRAAKRPVMTVIRSDRDEHR